MNRPTFVSASVQPTRVRLFFDQASDEQFLVLAEVLPADDHGLASHISVQTFQDEDVFLERLIAADLPLTDTALLAGTAIGSVGQTLRGRTWVELKLTEKQIGMLGLEGEQYFVRPGAIPLPLSPNPEEQAFDFADDASQFYHFLTQSPTPFVMLSGPEHRVTFINQPYVALIGRTASQEVLMKPIREVLPELEGQPFFEWLDEVYETGAHITRKAQIAYIRRPSGEGFEDRYFDFVYYPVRDTRGKVYGVMVQAADVTEKIQSEAISENREDTLFRQWAEIDAIYRTAPVGMALLDAKSLRLLRVNEKQAEMMGAPVDELLGRRALDLEFIPAGLAKLFERVDAGETVRNAVVEKVVTAEATGHRTWLVNISPFLGASGETLAFTMILLEIPDEP